MLDRLERVEPGVGERPDLAPLLDRRAVDLFDLAHEQRDQIAIGEEHRELVDGDVFTAFQHVDADDVATDRTDSGSDETERTRSVRKPDAHDETGHVVQVTDPASEQKAGRNTAFTVPSRTLRPVERLGILGGTFDPVHVAHLAAAAAARDQLDLARVLVVVAGDPWQKRGRVGAPAEARFEMVAAAIDGVDRLEASRLEIDRPGPTYTIDTVEGLAQAPDRELFLIVGSDVAASLDTWHRADALRAAVTLAIVDREDVAPSIPPPGWRLRPGAHAPARRFVDRSAPAHRGR